MIQTHLTVDGGEQWLSWAYGRVRALRALDLPFMTKRYVMGDGSTVTVRLTPEATYIELKGTTGGYLCLPRSIPTPDGVTRDANGNAVKAEATIKDIRLVSDPGLPEVDFVLKENTFVQSGSLDWKSTDDKEVISWGYADSGRYEWANTNPYIFQKGKATNVGKSVWGAAPLTRKSDGAKGYIYAHTADPKAKTEFFFYTGGLSTKLGEYIVPDSGVNYFWNMTSSWWFFNEDVTQGVSLLNRQYDPNTPGMPTWQESTMLLVDIINPPQGSMMAVAKLEGGLVGSQTANGTPGGSSNSFTQGTCWRQVLDPNTGLVVGWEGGGTSNCDYTSQTIVDYGQTDNVTVSVLGADYVAGVPTMVTARTTQTGGKTITESITSTHSPDGVYLNLTEATSNSTVDNANYELTIAAGSVVLFNDKTSKAISNTFTGDGVTGSNSSSASWRTAFVGFSHLDARNKLVAGVKAVSEGTTPAVAPGKVTVFAAFGDQKFEKDVGVATPNSVLLLGQLLHWTGGGGGGSRKKDEALATVHPVRVDNFPVIDVQIDKPSIVVAFKQDKRCDRVDKFTLGVEQGFNAEYVSIF